MAGVGVVSPHKLLQKERREIIILRKTPILPQPKDEILITNTSRKKQKEAQKTAPQPIAVARRNARERNRVKQVNNGFANLRQHIPSFIASTFESNSRGGNKKLSKVETLRMAVEYIRSLEDLLSLDDSTMSNASSVSSPTTYHDEDFYDVDDHILSDPSLMDADLEFRGAQDLSLLTGMHGGDSLSPGMYSEQSLSPGGSDQRGYGSTYGDEGKSEDVPVISLKTENELPQGGKNVMDVMQWWEQQQGTRATVS